MRIRLSYQNKIWFDELESGSQSFMEGGKLEKMLVQLFKEVCQEIMVTSDREDEVPIRLELRCDLAVLDNDGQVVKDHTPRGLFDLMPQSKRDQLQRRKKGGANNGTA